MEELINMDNYCYEYDIECEMDKEGEECDECKRMKNMMGCMQLMVKELVGINKNLEKIGRSLVAIQRVNKRGKK